MVQGAGVQRGWDGEGREGVEAANNLIRPKTWLTATGK